MPPKDFYFRFGKNLKIIFYFWVKERGGRRKYPNVIIELNLPQTSNKMFFAKFGFIESGIVSKKYSVSFILITNLGNESSGSLFIRTEISFKFCP